MELLSPANSTYAPRPDPLPTTPPCEVFRTETDTNRIRRCGRRLGSVVRHPGDQPLASREGGGGSKDGDKPRRGGLTPLAKSSPLYGGGSDPPST